MAETKIRITAETNQAEESLATLGEKVKQVDENFLGLRESLTTLGAALSAGALGEMIRRSIELGDSLNDMSKRTGASVETLSGLRLAAEQSGTSLEAVANATKKLAVSLNENRDLYAKLGISTTNQTEALIQLGDVFSKMEDPVQRSALAVKVFGKSGDEMIPLLMEGSAGIQRMIERGHELVPITAAMAAQSDAFNDSLAELKLHSSGAAITIANELLPKLNETVTALNELNESGAAFVNVAKIVSTGFETVTVLGANVGYVFKQAINEMGGMVAQLNALAHADFEGFKRIGQMMKEDAAIARKEIDDFSERVINADGKKARPDEAASGAGTRGADLLKGLGGDGKPKVDPNDAAVLALQNELFGKQMQLLGVLPEQVKVYELAMKGATTEQLRQAQAAADGAMQADQLIKLQKEEADAVKFTEKSMYELTKAREASLGVLVDLQLKEQLRNADMLVGLDHDRMVADVQLQITTTSIKRQRDAQLAALEEKRRIDAEHHALTLELEIEYEKQRQQIVKQSAAQIQDATDAAAQTRLKNEISVANLSANIRRADYGNAMTIAEQLTAGLSTHSRAAFELNKAAALASATIKGYSAVVSAFEDGMKVNYWVAIAEAAAAGLFVGAQLEAISSTQFNGGASNVAGGAGGGIPSLSTSVGTPVSVQPQAPPATAAPAKQQINVTLVGNSIDYDTMVNEFVPLLQEASGNGALDIRILRG